MSERALEITLFTLRAMANGGMHDHVSQVGVAMSAGWVWPCQLGRCDHVSRVGVTMSELYIIESEMDHLNRK